MSNHHHAQPAPNVPTELVAERAAGWHAFTRFVAANCVGIAVLLVLMLIFLRIL